MAASASRPLPMDWASDDFFLSRRISLSDSLSSSSHSIEFSRARPADSDFDSYADEQIIAIGTDPDPDPDPDNDPFYPIRWDCLQLHDSQRRDQIRSEDFEWEEVDGGINNSSSNNNNDGNNNTSTDLGWEVLVAASSLARTALDPEDSDSYLGEDHEFYTSDNDFDPYEVVVSHFSDHDSFLKSKPPAAKLVIENLPSVHLTSEELSKEEIQCAVCRDSVGSDQKVTRLPCMHNYHQDCIVPWLKVRNTCPLCRHELPTDDPEYENWRADRVTTNLSLSLDSDL